MPDGQAARLADFPLAAAQADIAFTLSAGTRLDPACAERPECPADSAGDAARLFVAQVGRLAGRLQAGVRKLYPERAPDETGKAAGKAFDVHVVAGSEAGSNSSPDGRIAISEAFAAGRPDDAFVAFVIAREMGHVIARHDEENSATGMLASVLLNIALPGSGILKSALAALGSRIAAVSQREEQAKEADVIARQLLKAADFRLHDVAGSARMAGASLDGSSWARDFRKSSDQLRLAAERDEPRVATASASGATTKPPYRLAAAAIP